MGNSILFDVNFVSVSTPTKDAGSRPKRLEAIIFLFRCKLKKSDMYF